MPPDTRTPFGREIYDGTFSGAQERPWIPALRSDPASYKPLPRSLLEFRELEGREYRKKRLRALWDKLPTVPLLLADHEQHDRAATGKGKTSESLTLARAKQLEKDYESELMGQCHGHMGSLRRHIGWKEFKRYAESKEVELWSAFVKLDIDGNGHLDAHELEMALQSAGIHLEPSTMAEFMTSLTSSPHSRAISFSDFRDFFLLLPREASPKEIYRYYEVKRSADGDNRGAARLTMDADVSLSAEDLTLPGGSGSAPNSPGTVQLPVDHEAEWDEDDHDDGDEHHHQHHGWFGGTTALKFLFAGGIAGAVSRTATAPFDRLKIFLMTRPPDLGGTPVSGLTPKAGISGAKAITGAVIRIYAEGGILGFWIGNGLSVTKIFPESAIKFLTYESSKRMFAKYFDHVEDTRDISGISRFMSGGIGGITSQLSIYPIETLKTQMMSSTGEQKRTLLQAARALYQLGGIPAYYRGLTIGLIGVFPYAAIDMSTFEALKLAYLRSTQKEEPGVMALLAFGSLSGSVGATTVYPLNLVRTRLQASGSSGHPQKYTGIWDVAQQTYHRDGWRGFYRGLFPTLAKVVPAVSISYVVYESSKRKLGV